MALDRDHLGEIELPLVHALKKLDGDGHFVGARHGEGLVSVEKRVSPGFQVDGGDSHDPAGEGTESLELALESLFRRECGRGSQEENREQSFAEQTSSVKLPSFHAPSWTILNGEDTTGTEER